jgi:serine/threonine-protein kinase
MADAKPQTRIGRYQIVERVGAGGMGEVYLAELVGAGGFRRRCAVKTTLPHSAARAEVETMFQREAVLAARIAHENVVQVFDFGKDRDLLFLVMEFVDGLTLRSLFERAQKRRAKLQIDEACALVLDVARGLDAIHSLKDVDGKPANVVHRDVTPDNVMVTREGVAKIGDFGIAVSSDMARLTMTGEIKGKVPYMAPEQLDGADVTAAADIFALGVTFTWLLTGKRPFDRATELGTMNAIVRDEPPSLREQRPDIPVAVERMIAAMLAKQGRNRPSAKQIVATLQQVPGARTRPKPLVTDVLGPQTRALAPPLETKVVTMPEPPSSSPSISEEPTLIASEPDAPTAPSEAALDVDGEDSASTTKRRPAHIVTAVTTERPRPPPSSRGLVVAAAIGLAVVAVGALFVWQRASGGASFSEDEAKLDGHPYGAVNGHLIPVVDAGVRIVNAAASDAGSADVDAGADPALLDANAEAKAEAKSDAGALEVVDAKPDAPMIELKGPANIAWFALDGRKLGAGSTKQRVHGHVVVAVDSITGARCTVAVERGVAHWDSVGTGALDVRANPYAHVYVGGRDLGITPLKPLPQLPACTLHVKLVYESKTRTESVRVSPNKTTSVRVDFE